MTAANPDAVPREFYDRPPPAVTDPALDPPLTVRAEGGHDWRTRLFDRDAVRAVRSTLAGPRPWLVIAGQHDELALTDDEVRGWAVVPAYAVSTPWARTDQQAAPAELVGDLGVEVFRG